VLPLQEKNNVIKTSTIIYSVNTILVYPQTALHQIKKNLKQSPCRKQRRLASGFARAAVTIPFIG